MGINFKAFPQETYLYVKSEGKWGSLDEHKQYNLEMYQSIARYQFNRILVNELDVVYPNNILDLYELAHFYDKELPIEVQLLQLVLVVKEKYKQLASFWELVCQNLGYQFKVFYSLEEARDWLLEKGPQ